MSLISVPEIFRCFFWLISSRALVNSALRVTRRHHVHESLAVNNVVQTCNLNPLKTGPKPNLPNKERKQCYIREAKLISMPTKLDNDMYR
jgi:hypothetical protein